jgi:endonuclease IV
MAATKIGIHLWREKPLDEGAARGADCVQFFLGDPQGWKVPPPGPDAAELAAAEMVVYVHAPYGINLASPNNRIRIPSRKLLAETCAGAAAVGAAGVIVHGGHVTAVDDEKDGFVDRVKAICGRIDLVHANDSKDPADSGRDRHENLGKGRIDLDTLVGIVQAAGAPAICETPGGVAEHAADIALLRSRLGGR